MIDVSQDVHAAIGGWAIECKPLLTQPAFDELERRVMDLVAAERAGLLDLFSKRMGISVEMLLEHLPELAGRR
jgi:hypothetical protein